MKQPLTVQLLLDEVSGFAAGQSKLPHPNLYGKNNGKAVGTYFEKLLDKHISLKFDFVSGNPAKGIDYPGIAVDVKVTSSVQPQSSCPFRSADQKVYGLGYGILLFVYDRSEDAARKESRFSFRDVVYIRPENTGDYQTTFGLRSLLRNGANKEEIVSFLFERNLPLDEVGADALADEILRKTPEQGYLTVTNALQWRLQYGRAISLAGEVEGVRKFL